MADLIDRQKALGETWRSPRYTDPLNVLTEIRERLLALPQVDAVEIVRCKDCKHRPTGTNRDDLVFPDYKCPCQCEDFWYSWKPSDDWFCGNGERKDGKENR